MKRILGLTVGVTLRVTDCITRNVMPTLRCLPGVLVLTFIGSSLVFGQATYREWTEPTGKPLDFLGAWELTLTPASEPVPALQYSLWPRYWDRQYGDATPHYYRALLMNAELPPQLTKDYTDKSEKWLANKLDDVMKEEMRTWLRSHQNVIKELETATYRERLDLDLRFRDLQGLDAISFLLPDAQGMRSLARILVIKARLEIAEGKHEEAIQTLRVGFRLSQAAAKTPTLINGLIGISIAGQMTQELTRLIASPNAPNMYWAITALPRPMIDLREGMEYESGMPLQIFAFLRDAETASRSPDEWRRVMLDAYQKLHELSGDYSGKPGPLTEIAATGLMMKGYPAAKRFLVDRGTPREKVDSMPVGQVLAIYTARTHRYIYDQMFKWTFLSPAQVHDKWDATFKQLREQQLFALDGPNNETLPITTILMPAVQNVWYAPLRLERQLAALRAIEAMRMYASRHGGALPESLDDIKEAVVPLDPMFDKPFPYHVDGTTAVLDIPPRPRLQPQHDAFRYVIKIKK